jgi:hypothetical protein
VKLKGCFLSSTTDVRTPKAILDVIREEFGDFDDPCPIGGTDGLIREWGSPVYVNPPYGKETLAWVAKAVEEYQKGKTVIMLLPARTDLKWFHDYVLEYATEIRFIRGRIRFEGYKSGAPFPSMLVIFTWIPPTREGGG